MVDEIATEGVTKADDVDQVVENLKTAMEELEVGMKKLVSNFKVDIRKAKEGADPSKNFTWEHFFITQCGILPDDARKYEEALIAHRLDPLDTIFESFGLIVEYGRIPVGDKIKISKTIERKARELESQKEAMNEAKKTLGLENYNDLDASMILEQARGESKYQIEYGIELFEEWKEELNRMVHFQMVKDQKAADNYNVGASLARLEKDPALMFLRSFGYETFEYTKSKLVNAAAVPTQPTSKDRVLGDLLLGNLTESESATSNPPSQMYS